MTALIRPALLFVLLIAAALPLPAQTREGVDLLLSKARSLEARGRMDLAAQNWNQVLLVDPNQTEALGGLARYAKQIRDTEGMRAYLDRLRTINPQDPAIDAIEKMRVLTPQEIRRLDEAGRLAAQQHPDEAMRLYREVFGDSPPPGKWAEAFYETEAASTGGREKAVGQLRDLTLRDPANEVYRLWLARVLTYSPSTRPEGLRLLESIGSLGTVDQARTIWRQALVWEKDNPGAQASLEAYLQRYPDRELQDALIAQNGFHALRENNLATAEAKFADLLRRSPNDINGLVGIGFVRLSQKKFNQARALFSRARELAPERSDVKEGYDTVRFWLAMERGAALQATKTELALSAYEEALAIRPQSEQPLLGIAQILMWRGNLSEAQAKFEQVVKQSPNNADALAGLGFVRLGQKDFDEAARLLARARTLAPDRQDIGEGARKARFWRLMQQGTAALNQNRSDTAVARYQEALSIDTGSTEALAGLAEATKRMGNLADAIKTFDRLTAADPADIRGWLGLMRTEADANDTQAVLETVQRIPPEARQQLEVQPEFLARLALAFYSSDQLGSGDEALARAFDAAARSDTEEAVNARLEVANLLMNQRKERLAASIFKQAADAHTDNVTAWEGLLDAYVRMGDILKAMAAVQFMPRGSYERATNRPGFLNVVATVYSAGGRCGEAEGLLNRAIELERVAGRRPAESSELQLADLWMREGLHEKALRSYREVLAGNERSTNGWRSYLTALHDDADEHAVLAEVQRMPAPVRTELTSDPNFLRLLSSAQSAVGHGQEAVELLQEARARHRALNQTPPADLDIQLAWTMMASPKHEQEVPALVAQTKSRGDLTGKHREALDEISSSWTIRTAEQAMRSQDPRGAIAILTDAARERPGNARIRSALALMYLQQHQYDRALAEYRSWGMAGADAGDYRAAAGAALAAQRGIVADRFLWEGRQRWPNDPELLHMTALQALSRGNFDWTEQYLTSALNALRGQESRVVRRNAGESRPRQETLRSNSDLIGIRDTACGSDPVVNSEAVVARSKPVAAQSRDREPIEPRDPPSMSAERLQDEIDIVRNRNTPVIGMTSPVTSRAGSPGLNRLLVLEGASSGSVTFGDTVRVGVEAHSLNLESGTPNGRSGYRFGTLPMGALFAEQTASGYSGDVQVSGNRFGVAVGLTPKEFLVRNWTGGLRLGAPDSSVRFIAVRENVKDSLLSYAGARDPNTGILWGGVVLNSGTLQFTHDESGNGQYISLGTSVLRGENVAKNWSAQSTAGAYWRVAASGNETLSVGLNVTGMHYDKNLNFFSLGHGGYFSPQRYLLLAVPVTWVGRRDRVEYEFAGSSGVQYLEEDQAPLYPIQKGLLEPFYDGDTHTGPNYNLSLRLDYHVASHWYIGAFLRANNAGNFASQSVGFTLKLLTSSVPTGTALRMKTIPDWKGDQPFSF